MLLVLLIITNYVFKAGYLSFQILLDFEQSCDLTFLGIKSMTTQLLLLHKNLFLLIRFSLFLFEDLNLFVQVDFLLKSSFIENAILLQEDRVVTLDQLLKQSSKFNLV